MMLKTYDEVVYYLKSYRNKLVWDRMFYLSKATSVRAISYTDEAPGTVHVNPIADNMSKVSEIEEKMNEIEIFIECNFTRKESVVLWARYIDGKRFEDIASELNYETSSIYKIHRKAIERYVRTINDF